MLGGYQPWGVLLLLSETLERVTFRYDYFSILPGHVLNHVEKQILQILDSARVPIPFEKILASVSDELNFLNGQRPRINRVEHACARPKPADVAGDLNAVGR